MKEKDFILRRFKLINEENKDKLLTLIEEKNLSREELVLILSSISLNEDFIKYKAINELIKNGAKLVKVGPYKSYDLVRKYSNSNERISGKVLILPS